MSSKPSSPLYSVPLLLIIFVSNCLADITPSNDLLPVDNVCNRTIDPRYCRSVLPNRGNRSIHSYSRSSVGMSLRASMKFSSLINAYLQDPSSLTISAVNALEDCQLLIGLNIDFLQSCNTTINSTNTLPDKKASELQTKLSAVLTNQQTCIDGIQAVSSSWNIKEGLFSPLTNGSKLYSLSLALFNRGWGNRALKRSRGNKSIKGSWGRGRNLLSNIHRQVTESTRNRKLLQSSDSVLVRDVVVVNPDGSGDYTTINAAVAVAPNNTVITDGYFIIYVVAGVYEEYVSIDSKKKNVLILGDGINQTVITGNRSVVDNSTTFNSATLIVTGQGFVAINITVRNTAGAIKGQAVALRNGADLSTFYSCSFEGYQDTLYTHSMRQFYRECDIYGTVDFIFGNAAVVLQDCNIYPRQPIKGQYNPITAQGRTDPNQNTGTSIQNCIIKAAPDLAASNFTVKTYLGRPWKEYSRTIYIQSFMDTLINSAGWREWSGDFALRTLYYAEYKNTGPGSNTTSRVTWPGYHILTNSTDAAIFTVSNFLSGDDWLPATGVPYDTGLL
ncbi:pectinesterase [Ranunculus cassubicifolius]